MARRFLLVCLLLVGCRETVEVDLSGVSEEVLNSFGSSYAVSSYLWMLSKYGLPDEVNGRYVQNDRDLWQKVPNEQRVTWTWLNGMEVTFRLVIDMHSVPTLSEHPPADLTVEDLQVCDIGEEFCVEFKIDGLDSYEAVTRYRVDMLVQKQGRWYFVWGGYPVVDWRGYRALWFVGWIDKEDVKRLMDGEEKVLFLVEIRDFLTGEQRKAVSQVELEL